MRYSQLFPKTMRSVTGTVKSRSYRLLLRGGFVRPLSTGLFSYTPLGMRVIRNIKRIMHQEMDVLGGQEVLVPVVNPVEIWSASGRDEMVGAGMVHFHDRSGRCFILAPTHEEAMVELVRASIRSYRDLPAFLYQYQIKYRDEERPRCGPIRAREFIMKDAYSFHRSFSELNNFFPRVFAAYRRIFERCGVSVTAAQAGVGYMGGELSYEFLMPAECGDDYLVRCSNCDYAANEDVAVGTKEIDRLPPQSLELHKGADGDGLVTVANGLAVSPRGAIKTMLFRTSDRFVMAIVRGDHRVSEEKLAQIMDRPIIGRAGSEDLESLGLQGPWLSPLDLPPEAREQLYIVADDAVIDGSNFLAGTNSPGDYYLNVNFGRDVEVDRVADVARAPEGAACVHCGEGVLRRERAMELGNIFRLGDFYSRRMDFSIPDENGKPIYPLMGSYGIGLGRLMSAIVAANNDERGIIWPVALAPYQVFLMSIGKAVTVRRVVEDLYERLGHNALFDDRHASIGRKFKDADLLGIPIRVVVAAEAISAGTVEIATRDRSESLNVPIEDVVATVDRLLREIKENWERHRV